jgi:hypothetical protein
MGLGAVTYDEVGLRKNMGVFGTVFPSSLAWSLEMSF